MTDDVTATLYAVKDGVTYIGETYTMSVRSYTMTKMASTTSEAGLTMMANMLYYGAMAQINRGYKTDDLANSELGDTYGGYVTTAVPSVTDTSSTTSNGLTGATKVQFALGNAASVQLQYVMKLASGVSADNIYAKAVYTHKGAETTVEIDGSQLVKQGSFYIAIVDSLWANEGRVPVSLTVYDKTTGEAISETWTFSIENYVASRQSSTNTNLVNTLNALMNYYDAAAAYYGS